VAAIKMIHEPRVKTVYIKNQISVLGFIGHKTIKGMPHLAGYA
jgi:hypothetical protein